MSVIILHQTIKEMKKVTISLIAIIAVLFASPSIAGKKENKLSSTGSSAVKVVVLDQITGEKLAGVCLLVGENGNKVYSDKDGMAIINLGDQDQQKLSVKYLSYEEKTVSVDEKDLKKKKLTIELSPILP